MMGVFINSPLAARRKIPSAPVKLPDRLTEFHPQAGDGFICEPALQVTHADGNTSTDLAYVKHSTTALDTNVSLTRIELKDRFFLSLSLSASRPIAREDVIEQWTEIRHDENGAVTLYRFASSSPLMAKAESYWLTQFHGDWAKEAQWAEERSCLGHQNP